jgi:uncharacterized delta-60 repeat protein
MTNITIDPESFNDVAISTDHTIFAAGYAYTTEPGSGSKGTIAAYNSDGSPDSSFATNSIFITEAPEPDHKGEFTSIEIVQNGKIVVFAEQIYDLPGLNLFRFNSDGTKDISFGTEGVIDILPSLPPDYDYDYSSELLLQPDGKILIAGTKNDTVFIARYFGDSVEAPNSIKDINSEFTSIWPNPFNEQINFTLGAKTHGNIFIRIINVSGSSVYEKNIANDQQTYTLTDLAFLPAGIYYLILSADDKTEALKIIRL